MPSKKDKPATKITPKLLRKWALPFPDEDGDKQARGTVLIMAGTLGMPGAAILCAAAALRAGAGKLQIATPETVADAVAAAVLEARVFPLSERKAGVPSTAGLKAIEAQLEGAKAIVLGPGMQGDVKFFASVLDEIEEATVVMDAEALRCYREKPQSVRRLGGQLIATPHAGEMAMMIDAEKDEVEANPEDVAREFAKEHGTITVLKGRRTFIASPEGELFVNESGNVGLATSGSGDVLAGIVGGLAARGADPLQAAVWGVSLHACAGDALEKSIGPLGYLARELLPVVPRLMAKFK